MADFTIYHNPRCGKSRATLALLEESGVEPRIIEYLKTPPSATEPTVKDPILIERPIVVRGEQAALGRPPENVKRLLERKASR